MYNYYFIYFSQSVVLFMSLFFFLQYSILKKKEQFYYGLYLLLLFIYYLLAIEFFFSVSRQNRGLAHEYDMFKRPVQFLISVAYTLFVMHYLGLKQKSPPLNKIFTWMLRIYLLLAVGCLVANYLRLPYDPVYYLVGLLLFPLQLYMVVALFKYTVPYARFVIWGSINVLVGSLLTLMLSFYMAKNPGGSINNVNVYYPVIISVLVDIFLFTVAIQRKIADTEKHLMDAAISRQNAVMQERERIVTDLHDDVGGGLSSIRMMSDLMAQPGASGKDPGIFATKISGIATEISQRMNTIIWSLNTENDSLENFAEYVRQYGVDYFEDSGIHFSCTTSPGLPLKLVLSGVQRKNLFLIVKEAFHNILKHAEASHASTAILLEEDRLLLKVCDDGVGLKNDNAFGNGLKNMKKRMQEIEGYISFDTVNGTCISISLTVL